MISNVYRKLMNHPGAFLTPETCPCLKYLDRFEYSKLT